MRYSGEEGIRLSCGKAGPALTPHWGVIHYRSVRIPHFISPTQKAPHEGVLLRWRSGWDSNPRDVAVKLISSQPRYDHFDTAPWQRRNYITTKSDLTRKMENAPASGRCICIVVKCMDQSNVKLSNSVFSLSWRMMKRKYTACFPVTALIRSAVSVRVPAFI